MIISNGFVSSVINVTILNYFDSVDFPFLDVDIPRAISYGVYMSQLIRFARVSSHVADFNTRNQILITRLLKQGYWYHKAIKHFQNSIDVTIVWFQSLIRDSNHFLSKAYRNLNFMATTNLRKLLVEVIFLIILGK